MLNFSHISILSISTLLTLSLSANSTFVNNTFANTELEDTPIQLEKISLNNKNAQSEKSSINLVELFSVKEHANEYIKNIEEKLRTTNNEEQEELLVELAQSLMYYQERHHQSPKIQSSSLKELNSKNIILNKALNAYTKAATLALNKNQIKYTRELSELAVSLKKKETLVQIFDKLLQHGGDVNGTYLAHVDYADGLAKFKDKAAESQFLSAVNMRTPVDGVEANFRYANYLLDMNKPSEALSILNKFTFDERRMYVHIALLRQKTMHFLKLDTEEVDAEMQQLRKNLSNSPFIGTIPKFKSLVKNIPKNILRLPSPYTFDFSHNNSSDDSRGPNSNSWITSPLGGIYSTSLINATEVIYNDARGASRQAREAIGWAIRNRVTIDMNGCGFYPGAKSHSRVNVCLTATPDGPQLDYSDLFKRYSCVVHGGTIIVGALHTQMNGTHVSIRNLDLSGILSEMFYIINGWTPERIGSLTFPTDSPSERDNYSGNPSGAQEWKNKDYCASKTYCKTRLGNIGGQFLDPGNLCPLNGASSTDIYFWGRDPYILEVTKK